MLGVGITLKSNWRVNIPDIEKSTGVVQIEAGPHPGKSGEVFPNILLLARPPKSGESLNDFKQSVLRDVAKKEVPAMACPVRECLSLEGHQPGVYKAEGDGHFVVTVFESAAPEFPGMIFEKPAGPQTTADGNPRFLRPAQRLQRFEGLLYYLVLLDTAQSVLEKAKSDYTFFLNSIRVE